MSTIEDFLGADHRTCDELFATAETAVLCQRWDVASALFDRFRLITERHLAMEEKVLFPAFEAGTGYSKGMTRVMRMEHGQMRGLMNEMETAVAARDDTEYLGLSETLNLLMQQHNHKEEAMLYPLSDQALAANRDELIRTMDAMPG